MQHPRDPAADSRLIEEATARARALRREAVGEFWQGLGLAARRLMARLAPAGHRHVQPEA